MHAIYRALTSKLARRIYSTTLITLLTTFLVTTTIIRVPTYLLTRKFQTVLRGLSKIQIDQTTEAEIPHLVPYLTPRLRDIPVIPPPGSPPNVDPGTHHFYYFEASNDDHWMRFNVFADKYSQVNYPKNHHHPPQSWIYSVAEWFGYRYLRLDASIIILNGKVSSIHYDIGNSFGFPHQAGEIVSASSVHSWWGPRKHLRVSPIIDQNPTFVVFGGDDAIHIKFAPEAPATLRNHIFEVDLRCTWSLTGCHHPVQITSALWRDKQEAEQSAFARLTSDNPCPDSLVAGRVRYVPDSDILFLESTGLPVTNPTGYYLDSTSQLHSHYRLIEMIRGESTYWKSSSAKPYVPDPTDSYHRLPSKNPERRPAGQRVLLLIGPEFSSCQVVPAASAALDAARNPPPAAIRLEDEIPITIQ